MIPFYTGSGAMDAQTLDERWLRNHEASMQRLALKERAIAFLGGKCQKCGYDKCPAAFDFHHYDPREKDFVISSRMAWSEALEAELKKCILLCANCHREAHAGWHPDLIADEDQGWGGDDFERDEELLALDWDDDADTEVQSEPPNSDDRLSDPGGPNPLLHALADALRD